MHMKSEAFNWLSSVTQICIRVFNFSANSNWGSIARTGLQADKMYWVHGVCTSNPRPCAIQISLDQLNEGKTLHLITNQNYLCIGIFPTCSRQQWKIPRGKYHSKLPSKRRPFLFSFSQFTINANVSNDTSLPWWDALGIWAKNHLSLSKIRKITC